MINRAVISWEQVGDRGIAMRLNKLFWLFFASFVLSTGEAFAEECTAEGAWKRIRAVFPVHAQILARCQNPNTKKTIIVLTEPPPHIVPGNADAIIRALFTVQSRSIGSVQRRRQPLGYDGYAEDLVIEVDTGTPQVQAQLDDSLASLAGLAFGSTYKAGILEVDQLPRSIIANAPPAVEVGKEELFSWLLGPAAQKLTLLDGGGAITLQERVANGELGTYYSVTPGLVVAIVPRGSHGLLNDRVEDLRRFVVDTDEFLGAIKLSDNQVALVGRERTTALAAVPPMRLETVMLLASTRAPQLAQSYERLRAFAGKLLSDAGETFGWDWAPILLSDEIIDTEFGSLLNFTDDMLKSWSNAGKVEYAGFPYPNPSTFPFGGKSARDYISANKPLTSLTYNWNTAGVGLLSTINGTPIFTIRNTGSLPVSYFPEGTQDDAALKKSLVQAEDQAYAYFRNLKIPLLQRAVQLAAFYQVFAAFDVRATRPEEMASTAPSMKSVEKVLAANVTQALGELVTPNKPANRELLLNLAFDKEGYAARKYLSGVLNPVVQERIEAERKESADIVRALDLAEPKEWRAQFANKLANGTAPMSSDVIASLAQGIKMVHSADRVRQDVVRSTDRVAHGWIRTPSIVLSNRNKESFQIVGGHNIGGRVTRVEFDANVPKGQVRVLGSYQDGRVLRLNPADKDAEREAVRIFDREVGLRDENEAQGARAVEAKLAEGPIAARPVRSMAEALDMPPRTARGAVLQTYEKPLGFGTDTAVAKSSAGFDAVIRDTGADVIVAPSPPGYLVVQARPAPPKMFTAPNPTSMREVVDLAVRQASLGPPTVANPKVTFQAMQRGDVSRLLDAMARRGEAVAGAGGKPPFGGSRNLFALADGPDPQRPFTASIAGREVRPPGAQDGGLRARFMSAIEKGRQRIYSESAGGSAELAAKPQWSQATVRFVEDQDTMFIGMPRYAGYRHVVEVTVPVTVNARPQSIFVRALSWFKDAPTGAKSTEMKSSVEAIFKSSDQIDVQEALIRYKTLMVDHFGAANVEMHLSREGNDIVVVELEADEVTRRG
jgi:hypothetical protein